MTLLSAIDIEDVAPDLSHAQRTALIETAEAIAAHYAPCLRADEVPEHVALVAKAVIKKAIAYDIQAEAAGVLTRQHEQLGPYGVTNFAHRSGTLFSPSQIDILRALCGGTSTPGVYSISLDVPDTLPGW